MALPITQLKYKDKTYAVPEPLQKYSEDYLTKMLDTTEGTFEDLAGVDAYIANNPYTETVSEVTPPPQPKLGNYVNFNGINMGWFAGGERKTLRENGFSYIDADTGETKTVEANSLNKKLMRDLIKSLRRLMKRNAELEDLGLNPYANWSTDAANLVKKNNERKDLNYITLRQAPEKPKEFAWNYASNLGEGDWDTRNVNVLKAIYENKNKDLWMQIAGEDGTIDANDMLNWQKTLGIGKDFSDGMFGRKSLDALKAKNYITESQYNSLVNGLPEEVVALVAAGGSGNSGGNNLDPPLPPAPTDWSKNSEYENAMTLDLANGLDGTNPEHEKILQQRIAAAQLAYPSDFNEGKLKSDATSYKGYITPLNGVKSGGSTYYANHRVYGQDTGRKGTVGANGQITWDNNSDGVGNIISAGNNKYKVMGRALDGRTYYTKVGGPDNQYYIYNNGVLNRTPNLKVDKTGAHYKFGGRLIKKAAMGTQLNQQLVAQEQQATAQKALGQIFEFMAKGDFESGFALAKQAGIPGPQLIQLVQKSAEQSPQAKQVLANLSSWAQQNPDQYQSIMQQATYAKQGTKLQYIKRLRGECPEGFEMQMFKVGGKVCKKCMKKAQKVDSAKCGKKLEAGGESKIVSDFKSLRCGGKTKKKEDGGVMSEKCGGTTPKKKKC